MPESFPVLIKADNFKANKNNDNDLKWNEILYTDELKKEQNDSED